MSSETGASILDAVLAFIGERISIVVLQPGNKDKNYQGYWVALQTVPVCLDIVSPLTNQGLQQEASVQFHARMLERFKIVKEMQSDIAEHLLPLKNELQDVIEDFDGHLTFWEGSLLWKEHLQKIQEPWYLV